MGTYGMNQACAGEGGFTRVHYFTGQLLNAADLRAEQDYHINKRRLLNRCLFGSRVICGLEIQIEDNQIVISSGLALDCSGREIYVSNTERIALPDKDDDHFLALSYCEVAISPVPVLSEPTNPQEEEYSRMKEGFDLSWRIDNPLSGHDWRGGAWTTCGESHPLVLARVKIQRGRVGVNEKLAKRINAGRTEWC